MGIFFSYYETSFELPDYGEWNFKHDIDTVSKAIEFLENNNYNYNYNNFNDDKFYEFKLSYNQKIMNMNEAIKRIPPSRRELPEFKTIVSKMRALGYKPPEPIKYTLIPN